MKSDESRTVFEAGSDLVAACDDNKVNDQLELNSEFA